MLLNCGAREDFWTARRSNQSIQKEISSGCSWEGWSWNSNTLATWCEEVTHLKRPWYWERLKKKIEKGMIEDEMVALTQWTWVWVISGSWWWIMRPGVLQSMGSPRVRHHWVTELNWTEALAIALQDSDSGCLSLGSNKHRPWFLPQLFSD